MISRLADSVAVYPEFLSSSQKPFRLMSLSITQRPAQSPEVILVGIDMLVESRRPKIIIRLRKVRLRPPVHHDAFQVAAVSHREARDCVWAAWPTPALAHVVPLHREEVAESTLYRRDSQSYCARLR